MEEQLIKKEFEQLKATEELKIPLFESMYNQAQALAKKKRIRRRSWQIAATVLVLLLAGSLPST